MDLSEYQTLALVTANKTNPTTLRLAVAGMGLAGEAAEVLEVIHQVSDHQPLDLNKLNKELGDVLWYIAELASTCDLSLVDIVIPLPDRFISVPDWVIRGRSQDLLLESALTLMVQVGKTTDYLKKIVGHNHPTDKEKILQQIALCLRAVLDVCHNAKLSMSDVCDANIAKLKLRYPEGFSTERSIQRPD